MRPIPLILLAAGKSERMGVPKVLMPFQSKTWVEFQSQQILKSRSVKEIIVVVRSEFRDQLENLKIPHLKIVDNSLENSEPWQSLEMAIAQGLQGPCLISPIDIPQHPEIIDQLVGAMSEKSHEGVFLPEFAGKAGHPILLGSINLQKFQKRPSRLDHFLKTEMKIRIPVAIDWIHRNINTPVDLREFEHRTRSSFRE